MVPANDTSSVASFCHWLRRGWQCWRYWRSWVSGMNSIARWSSLITDINFTIPLGINLLKGYMMTGSISVVLAGVVLSMIPVIMVYLFGQRYLIEGIMMGGLKG